MVRIRILVSGCATLASYWASGWPTRGSTEKMLSHPFGKLGNDMCSASCTAWDIPDHRAPANFQWLLHCGDDLPDHGPDHSVQKLRQYESKRQETDKPHLPVTWQDFAPEKRFGKCRTSDSVPRRAPWAESCTNALTKGIPKHCMIKGPDC